MTLPNLDYRVNVGAGAICILLFAWAYMSNDIFGLGISVISGITNFASALFNYTFNTVIEKQKRLDDRQFLIQQTVGE